AEFREHTRPLPEPAPPTPQSFEEQMAAHLTTASSLCQSEADARSVRLLADSLTGGADAGRVRRLRALLTDPQSDSYHVAAAKLARLQEHYTVGLYEASQRAQAFPGSVELQAALAEGYVDYLRSGLLDGQFSEFYYGLAVQRFELLAQLQPDEPMWRLRIAELHRRNGRYDEALASCESILQQWPENSEARMRILEIYYYGARRGMGESTRQFVGMLKRLKDEIQPEQIEDPSLQESARWWFRRA
ncbi:MAG: tetratricopeptide repeat protein, partial [Candidatus Eremiobacteraeota bacterium]|nr:tetratricopeptide repeat protein [Candidatus Eremiobacteraeota bacterium]